MSKPITVGQYQSLMSILANGTDWDSLDGSIIQRIIDNPKESAGEFTRFLHNGAKCSVQALGKIIIDRSSPLRLLEGDREWMVDESSQDQRSLALSDLDLSSLVLEPAFRKGIPDYYIKLDAKICETFWENQYLIPESWKNTGGEGGVIFSGTTILHQREDIEPLYLCLYWDRPEGGVNDPFLGMWNWRFVDHNGDGEDHHVYLPAKM